MRKGETSGIIVKFMVHLGNTFSFNPSFLFFFLQQIFIEHLLYSRHYWALDT